MKIGYLLEAAGAYLVYGLISILPVDWASALGGWLGRNVGPRLGVSKRAAKNLSRAFPEKSSNEIDADIRSMWENLMRTAAEYPHVDKFWDEKFPEDVETIRSIIADYREQGGSTIYVGKRIEVEGIDHLDALLSNKGPAIFFSAHLGNWEVLPAWAARVGFPISVVFRRPNNPYVAPLLERVRRGHGPLLPKGVQGALASVKVLEDGGRLGMLMDQKQNRGIGVPFFGRTAMTAPTIAKLALRYNCPIYGAWVQRLNGARFRIHFSPLLARKTSGDEDSDILDILTKINTTIEGWIGEQPGQWMWMHRRWRD